MGRARARWEREDCAVSPLAVLSRPCGYCSVKLTVTVMMTFTAVPFTVVCANSTG